MNKEDKENKYITDHKKCKKVKGFKWQKAIVPEPPKEPKFTFKNGVFICECGETMYKVEFPDIGLCWSCKCGKYIVIEE